MIGCKTGAGVLSVKEAGFMALNDAVKHDDFARTGTFRDFYDLDRETPDYYCLVVDGKLTDEGYRYDIVFTLLEDDKNNKVARGSTKSAFLTWFKRNVKKAAFGKSLRDAVKDLMQNYEMQEKYWFRRINNGFPYVYVDLREWFAKCK